MRLHRARLTLPIVVLLVAGTLFGSSAAQEATPTPEAASEPVYPLIPAAPEGHQVATPGGTLPGNPAIQLVKVADGLLDPINIASPPDGSGRIFVVERHGTIRVIDSDGTLLDEPFLDIRNQVLSQFLEDGLLDMAFDPDFQNNGYFYIAYTDLLYNGDVFIMRYSVSEDDPNKADPESGTVIMFREQPYANHVGGSLTFGPDGYLYIGVGDGGLEGDPLETGQNVNDLLGSLLRIDVHPDNGQPYGIPPDNPFADSGPLPVDLFALTEEDFAEFQTEARPEVWAWGLRNPWEVAFDRETGDLYIADVGQNVYEEINFVPAGQTRGLNFGWDVMEASHCFPVSIDNCAQVGILPVAEYQHGADGCSITGGGVYRGDQYPSLDGIYFASDWCSGKVWGLARDENGVWQFQELLDTELRMTGGGQGEDGTLYFTSCDCAYGAESKPNGAVWKLVSADQVPDGAEIAPAAMPEATPMPGEMATPED
ncbi:MAG TPA: PQQ-dependent sugar dehydrogenase [Thermomicrobiales bacterium]